MSKVQSNELQEKLNQIVHNIITADDDLSEIYISLNDKDNIDSKILDALDNAITNLNTTKDKFKRRLEQCSLNKGNNYNSRFMNRFTRLQ